MQPLWPVLLWNWSLGQLWQMSPLSKRPLSHLMQAVWPLLCWTEPAGHGVQVGWSLALEKVCGWHFAHERSVAWLSFTITACPGVQLRASENGTARESMQKCPGGHGSQDPLLTLPNVPATHETLHEVAFAALNALHSQRVHGAVFKPALKCPAGHGLHGGPFEAAEPGGQAAAPFPMPQLVVSPAVGTKLGLSAPQSLWSRHSVEPF
jgi:hypothetical protein